MVLSRTNLSGGGSTPTGTTCGFGSGWPRPAPPTVKRTGGCAKSKTSPDGLLVLAAESREFGRGGVTLVARAAGVSPTPVAKALRELEAGAALTGRVAPAGRRSYVVDRNGSGMQGCPQVRVPGQRVDGLRRWRLADRLSPECSDSDVRVDARRRFRTTEPGPS